MKTPSNTKRRDLRLKQLQGISSDAAQLCSRRLGAIGMTDAGFIVLTMNEESVASSSSFGEELPEVLRRCATVIEALRSAGKNNPTTTGGENIS